MRPSIESPPPGRNDGWTAQICCPRRTIRKERVPIQILTGCNVEGTTPSSLPTGAGCSWNSTTSRHERRRDRGHDTRTGRQAHSTCPLAVRLAERLRSALLRARTELQRRILECLPQGCDLRWQQPLRYIQAPSRFGSRITHHPASIFHRQGRATAATTAIRTTPERPRDADAERVQEQSRWRWHRRQD